MKITQGGNLLTLLTVTSVAVGLGLGIGLWYVNAGKWIPRDAMYLKLPGDLFLRALSALVLPLVFSSLVAAIGSLDLNLSKKIGTRALVYYFCTTVVAAVLGTSLVHFISPGTKSGNEIMSCGGERGSSVDTLLDLLRNILPPNIIGAALFNTQTEVTPNASLSMLHTINPICRQGFYILNGYYYSILLFLIPAFEIREFKIVMKEGTNMLGLIVFALILGITLSTMAELGKPLLLVFSSMANATLKMTTKLIW